MRELKKNKAFVLFSVFQSDRPNSENEANNLAIRHSYCKPIKQVLGVYKGVPEKSFYLEVDSVADISEVLNTIKYYKQESILLVDENRQATLIFISGRKEKIGEFVQVPKEVAITEDSYTYDKVNGGYYICK